MGGVVSVCSRVASNCCPRAFTGTRCPPPYPPIVAAYTHGLRIGNPVVFISIDGEIAREIEGQSSDARDAIHKFKKKLRHCLQRLGFNTLEPSVHADLVTDSAKRLMDDKNEATRAKGGHNCGRCIPPHMHVW